MHDMKTASIALSTPGGMVVDIGFSICKKTIIPHGRSLRSAYTVELAQDLYSSYGIDFHSSFEEAYMGKAKYHKHKKEKWLNEYTHRIKKMKGVEKLNTQHTIDSLKNQVKNHEELFAEYYL